MDTALPVSTEMQEDSLESFPGAAGSDSVNPKWISSCPCHARALPAPMPACAPEHAAASSAERPGTPGQQGGGNWRRGVKLQSFWYISIGQGLSKTTASPSLGKCFERNQDVPQQLSLHRVPCMDIYGTWRSQRTNYLSSQPIFLCNANCLPIAHVSVCALLPSLVRKGQSLPQSCARWNHQWHCSVLRLVMAANSRTSFPGRQCVSIPLFAPEAY